MQIPNSAFPSHLVVRLPTTQLDLLESLASLAFAFAFLAQSFK